MVTSVVIAAHNEEGVLGRGLRRLLGDARPGEFEVIVVANGCTDGTAELARSVPGVRVLELPAAGKPAALNAGDAAASGFPRLYLDADVELDTDGVRALAAAVDGPAALAAAPRRVLDTTGRPLLVRAYFAVHGRLPVFRGALFGRGAVAVSRAGRARFDRFPDQVADDLFLDSLFLPGERRELDDVDCVVATPRRTADLLRRLVRVRAGNTALRRSGLTGVRRSRRASWLVDVVLPRPWLLPAGACYAVLSVLAGLAARRSGGRATWGRDESSRTPEGAVR
ncbi:glycosyltransferase [Micromonospora echinofusca]|uniref:glycosyltransferase n=1 Tax=Micromonospora echinofusca TaxID=47858 RepID=UPI001FCB3B5B|nr:glycosyltransferase [Micromonospora echinofusca]